MGDSRIEPNPFGSEGYAFPHTTATRHLHISHNAPYLPTKVLQNLCFSFLLGITSLLHSRTKNGCVADYRVLLGITPVPREIENITYANLGGQIRCIMGHVQGTLLTIILRVDFHCRVIFSNERT